jgi:hypothetical protein
MNHVLRTEGWNGGVFTVQRLLLINYYILNVIKNSNGWVWRQAVTAFRNVRKQDLQILKMSIGRAAGELRRLPEK